MKYSEFPFQSTRPMRGATQDLVVKDRARHISIHAPHAGRDYRVGGLQLWQCSFQSTRPMRGATSASPVTVGGRWYFNPRAPCGARPSNVISSTPLRRISIHAPHAGRDRGSDRCRCATRYFNPRAPCGARLSDAAFLPRTGRFQSTRPMRGATV